MDTHIVDLPHAHPPYKRYYDNLEKLKENIINRKSKGNAEKFAELYETRSSILSQVSCRSRSR